MQTVYSLKSKMVDDLVEHLISPLQKFLREDVRKIKETGRNFEKTMEKFDAALIKYCSLSKLKEPSALKEDEFQLFEIRKSYVKGLNDSNLTGSLDYTFKLSQFKQNLEVSLLEQLSSALFSQSDFFDSCNEVFKGYKQTMDAIKTTSEAGRQKMDSSRIMASAKKKTLEETSISRAKPSAVVSALHPSDLLSQAGLPNVTASPLTGSTSLTRATSTNTFKSKIENTLTEKEGHLFKRSQVTGLIVPVWSRKYFCIKDGGFTWTSLSKRKDGKSQITFVTPISVLLCNVRVWAKEDRRFTFEIYTSKNPLFCKPKQRKT